MFSAPSGKTKILILAANPKGTDELRLNEEVREIDEGLLRSRHRDKFDLESKWAVREQDFYRHLLSAQPQIVHFSGHGGGERGLVLEDVTGKAQLLQTEQLAALFKLFVSKGLRCVVLNACYSEEQAKAIGQHVDYVIGMNKAIGDKAAIAFAVTFYDALGAGEAVEFAFELARTRLMGMKVNETPVLMVKATPSTADGATLEVVQQPSKNTNPAVATPVESPSRAARVFISYRSQEPDKKLAQEFHRALKAVGHVPFLAGESIRLGENWAERIDAELEQSDYFLLLLSEQSAVSEMVTEEVRRAKQLRDSRQNGKPVTLPVRVNFPMDAALNYDLRGYLQRIQQREWRSPADTQTILQEILALIGTGQPVEVTETRNETREAVTARQDSPDLPPLPIAEPELHREPGGSVPLDSGLYVQRSPIEESCYREILQPGALIRIKAPRQMGKTSLMARILNHAREQGYQTIPLSFQRADSDVFTDLDKLLRWFCEQVGRRTKRLDQLENYWKGYGVKDRCNYYFEECLLTEIDTPIVLGLDEVDLVFPHKKVVDDFFSLLRSWYESARYGDLSSERWEKLRLVVVHSTEVYVPLNINQSPFNVGMNVELPELNHNQIQDLVQRYGLSWSESQVSQLIALVGGHPYLVRKALYHVRRQDVTLAAMLENAATEAGIYIDHLRRHLLNLQTYPALAVALRQVVGKSGAVELDSDDAYKLESIGLVTLKGNEVSVRCELYRRYFQAQLAP